MITNTSPKAWVVRKLKIYLLNTVNPRLLGLGRVYQKKKKNPLIPPKKKYVKLFYRFIISNNQPVEALFCLYIRRILCIYFSHQCKEAWIHEQLYYFCSSIEGYDEAILFPLYKARRPASPSIQKPLKLLGQADFRSSQPIAHLVATIVINSATTSPLTKINGQY